MAIYRGEGGELYSLGIPQWGAITGDIDLQLDLKAKFDAVNEAIGLKASVASVTAVESVLSNKQDTLISGTNIKTVNGNSLLGTGNLTIASASTWGTLTGTLSDQTDLQTALDSKLNSSSVSSYGLTLLDDGDAPTARSTLGLGTAATQNTGAFATAAQGALADASLQPATIGVTVQGYDVDTAKLDVAQAYTARQRFVQTTCPFTTLTYAASLQPNLATSQAHVVTATGNATLNQPLNEDSTNFQSFQLEFIQDATGGRTLGFNTTFYEAAVASFPVVTSTANRKTVLLFNRQSNGKYLVIAVNDVRST